MLDFTSALYLGLHHPSRALRPWASLATGRPALLEPGLGAGAEGALAGLMGCEEAMLMPSTLHLFWDLLGWLAAEPIAIHLDAGAYPIPRWGAERAAALGVPVRVFRHHSPAGLLASVRGQRDRGLRPVAVTDGFCPACGRPAPLPDYLEILRRRDGLLVLDDTQALGLLGRSPGPGVPYGFGGGGSLRHFGLGGPDILAGSSLAKGFGVPVAVLGGGGERLAWFRRRSLVRTHCSPPSVAVIHAAEHALAMNAGHGDRLRRMLARLVARFREGLARLGLRARGGWFPVQILEPMGLSAAQLHRNLLDAGVRTVPLQGHGTGAVGFLFTARHRPAQIDRLLERLALCPGVPAGLPLPRECSHEQPIRV